MEDYTSLLEAIGLFTTGVFFLLAVWMFFLFNIPPSMYSRKLGFLSIVLITISIIYFVIAVFKRKATLKVHPNKVILINEKQSFTILKAFFLKGNQFISSSIIKILWDETKKTSVKLAPNLYYFLLPIQIFSLTILIIILYASLNLLRIFISLSTRYKEKNLVCLQFGNKITEFRLVLLSNVEQLKLSSYIPIKEV